VEWISVSSRSRTRVLGIWIDDLRVEGGGVEVDSKDERVDERDEEAFNEWESNGE
jgi:hypothetical protein